VAAPAAPTPQIYVNGKFAAQRTTGVQRVSARLLLALDAQVPPGRWTLLCPPQTKPPALQHIRVRQVGPAGLPLHAWEQLVLPWAARHGWLLSMSGAAPAFARRQVVALHDAAVFDHPTAYTPAFVAWYRWLFRRLARRALGVFTVSAFSRGRLASVLGVPPARFTLLGLGADHLQGVAPDLSLLDRHGLRAAPFLLAVASANPTKNLPALVAAFAGLPPGPQRLVIAGGGNAQVFAAAASADPAGVLRIGPVDDAGLVALYGQARALVFPSIYEGFGLPPLEAMACGCPVAAARAASIPEACGDAALYFDPQDTAAITSALQALLTDEPSGEVSLRERLREAGMAQAARYRWADAAAGLRVSLQRMGLPA
jgi:glycosyltransferase involved in cell wall biosynthesis